MPILIMRLQSAGISVRSGFTRNGKSKGISYEKDGQAFSGTQLGAAYTFPGLQKYRSVDYQPQRDDKCITELLLNPVQPTYLEQPQQPVVEAQEETKLEFVPPPEDESLWPALQNYLTQQRGLEPNLVQALHELGLVYALKQRNIVFIKRGLNGEKLGAQVLDTHQQSYSTTDYPEYTSRSHGWFHLKLGGKSDDEIERVFLCDSPIDALSLAVCDTKSHKGLPPVKTMYLAVDSPDDLPVEFLRNINKIGLAFNSDEQANKTASAVLELLPQSKRVAPLQPTWNLELLALLHSEQEKSKQQRSRGFSR